MGIQSAKYIMVGGFLGAGKTTAILQLASVLRVQGKTVGLITNDQSYGLVDTVMLAANGFAVEEITGGCFCCKFNSLIDAADKLNVSARPDVFIAEPVGSCTDLKATVDYPLRRMYGDNYEIAPLTVLVDPLRAQRIMGLASGRSFSENVIYIYRKQLEEADIIGVNKSDLLEASQLTELMVSLQSEFPNALVINLSARNAEGLHGWLDAMSKAAPRISTSMEVDYDRYADGEALLGWVNAAFAVGSDREFDGNVCMANIAGEIRDAVQAIGGEIAHLKLTLTPHENGNDLCVINLVRNGHIPEISHRLHEELESGDLIVNLRAEADPHELERVMLQAVSEVCRRHNLPCELVHNEAFRPGRPVPIHRLASV